MTWSLARWQSLLYVAPAALWISFIYLIPIASVIGISLSSGVGPDATFIGLDNFRLVFRDPLFWQAIWHNIQLLAIVPVLVFLSLVFASVLFDRVRGWRAYQLIIFIPVILAVAAMGIAFGELLQLRGPLNEALRAVGLGALAQEWLGDARFALGSIGGIIVWKEVGFGTLLFLARMMSIDPELYDAATSAGASWWQRMRHVTIPQLIHVIEFYVVLLVVTAFAFVFDYILVITNGGPSNSTVVGEFFIYRVGFAGARARQPTDRVVVSRLTVSGRW
jgi:ABC-type sugar transport system permease subunit